MQLAKCETKINQIKTQITTTLILIEKLLNYL